MEGPAAKAWWWVPGGDGDAGGAGGADVTAALEASKQGRVFMALAAGLALAVTLTSDSSEKTSRDENNEK